MAEQNLIGKLLHPRADVPKRERRSQWKRPFTTAVRYFQRPLKYVRTYDRSQLRPDFIAGLTVGIITLPQAIAFALIANLPPQMGLYAALIGLFIGAMWGSCYQLITIPTNTISLLVFTSLATAVEPGTALFVVAAGLMAVMVGVLQLVMGLARLGLLINFVSHSVIIGFATGAGILIGISQLTPLLGLNVEAAAFVDMVHRPTAVLGLLSVLIIVVVRRINNRLPASLLAMVLASALVAAFNLHEKGVVTIGQLPAGLPPLAQLPVFNLELIGQLGAGALAVAAISLIQTMAVAQSVAAQTGQRLDSNQEFVGQGLANIFMGLFSGYAGSGSFSVTAVNRASGARTPFAAVFASLFILLALFTLGPLTVYLPRAAVSGALVVTAVQIINVAEIRRILQSHYGEAIILVATLMGTLFLDLTFAVLLGIIFSFILYILRTSAPRVHEVKPDLNYKHFLYQPDKPGCPQLGIIEILGDLYFGAVHHVEEYILDHAEKHPEQRYLLIRMHNVNNCDFSGVHMLENVVKAYRERGGDIFLVRPQYQVKQIFASTDFVEHVLGPDHLLDKDMAITNIFYHVLDPAICIYECPVRVFQECANLPKRIQLSGIPYEHEINHDALATISAQSLWQQLHAPISADNAKPLIPVVIDVREPREFRQGHIIEAESIPLARILANEIDIAKEQPIVLVCRSGRRSRRAAAALQQAGYTNITVLQGGMQAWEAATLLEAVD